MEAFLGRIRDFFNGENLSHLWQRVYEWFEITLKTLFGKIPYEPVKDLFTNPWFWFIVLFLIIIFLIFRKR